MNRPLLAANWKLNKTLDETRTFINELIPFTKNGGDIDIVLAPPFTSLYVACLAAKYTNIMLAAQDVFYEDRGAYTGEISPAMIVDAGCSHVIIGHSERRQYFYDTDDVINKKIKASKRHNLTIIFCIGESLSEREQGKALSVLKRQLEGGLKEVTAENIVIAYEPVWAIGTGKTATPSQAQEVHKYIREWLTSFYGAEAKGIRIIYGGSVTPDNINSLMDCKDVDGALVGGASLRADSFAKIVNFKRRKS